MVPSIPRRTGSGWSVGPWRGLEASSSSSFPSGPGERPATAASAQASSARVLLLPGPPPPPPSPSGLGAAASGELERAAAEDRGLAFRRARCGVEVVSGWFAAAGSALGAWRDSDATATARSLLRQLSPPVATFSTVSSSPSPLPSSSRVSPPRSDRSGSSSSLPPPPQDIKHIPIRVALLL